MFKPSFCRTGHSLQGLTLKSEYCNIFDSTNWFASRNWVATAITRCQNLNICFCIRPRNQDVSLDSVLDKKIRGYKQQDNKANRDTSELITLRQFKNKIKRGVKCVSCGVDMEISNLTLDRIDNNLSHTNKNTVLMCLHCNVSKQ